MTDADLIALIADGIVDGTDLDCTTEDQARAVLKALRDAGVVADAAEVQRLREALRYYAGTFCEMGPYEGFCGKLSPDDCSGCTARAALGDAK